jgi:hypothetical protein
MRAKTIKEEMGFNREFKPPIGLKNMLEGEEGIKKVQDILKKYFDIGRVFLEWDKEKRDVSRIIDHMGEIKEAIELLKSVGVDKNKIQISHYDHITIKDCPQLVKGNWALFPTITEGDFEIMVDLIKKFGCPSQEKWNLDKSTSDADIYWMPIENWRTGEIEGYPLDWIKELPANREKYKKIM